MQFHWRRPYRNLQYKTYKRPPRAKRPPTTDRAGRLTLIRGSLPTPPRFATAPSLLQLTTSRTIVGKCAYCGLSAAHSQLCKPAFVQTTAPPLPAKISLPTEFRGFPREAQWSFEEVLVLLPCSLPHFASGELLLTIPWAQAHPPEYRNCWISHTKTTLSTGICATGAGAGDGGPGGGDSGDSSMFTSTCMLRGPTTSCSLSELSSKYEPESLSILQQFYISLWETTTPLLLLWRLYPFQNNDTSPCRELNEKKSRSSRQEIALRYLPEPKTVLRDYPTVVDLNFILHLPRLFYPSNPRKALQWQAQQNEEKEEDATKRLFYAIYSFYLNSFLINLTKKT